MAVISAPIAMQNDFILIAETIFAAELHPVFGCRPIKLHCYFYMLPQLFEKYNNKN